MSITLQCILLYSVYVPGLGSNAYLPEMMVCELTLTWKEDSGTDYTVVALECL